VKDLIGLISGFMTIFGVTIWSFLSSEMGIVLIVLSLVGFLIYRNWQRYFKQANFETTESDLKAYFIVLEKDFNAWKKRFILDSRITHADYMPAYAQEVEWFIDLNSKELENDQPISKTIEEWRAELLENKSYLMMISGKAGIGKTTCLRYLVYQDKKAFQQLKKVPIYIELKNIQTGQTLKSLMLEKLKHGKLATALNLNEVFEHWLTEGVIRLYLDGWNELARDLQNNIKQELNDFINQYPEVFIMISIREVTPIFNCLRAFVLQNMDRSQVIAFIERNSDRQETDLRNLIFERIYRQERFLEFITVPLYALMLIQLVRVDKKIPKSHSEMIHLFISKLLKREQQVMGSTIEQNIGINLDTFRHLLGYLAYVCSFENQEQNIGIARGKIHTIFCKKQPTLTDQQLGYILKEAVELGLLINDQEIYSFTHQEYQTHFAQMGKRIEEGKPA